MLSSSLRTWALRARHQGCIALCSDGVWAAQSQSSEQEGHCEHASMQRYATLAATLGIQQGMSHTAVLGGQHRTFFSWGAGTPATPATPATPTTPATPDATLDAADAIATPNVFDVSQIVDVAAMAETHALQAAAEGAWPNTIAAQYLVELLHSGAGLGWYARCG